MTEKTMQDTTRTCGTATTINPFDCAIAVVFDITEINPGATLYIRCRTCRQFFGSDHEESHCGSCVARRELTAAIAP
jgi:hypothetical protein